MLRNSEEYSRTQLRRQRLYAPLKRNVSLNVESVERPKTIMHKKNHQFEKKIQKEENAQRLIAFVFVREDSESSNRSTSAVNDQDHQGDCKIFTSEFELNNNQPPRVQTG